jgi:hypothetical protein
LKLVAIHAISNMSSDKVSLTMLLESVISIAPAHGTTGAHVEDSDQDLPREAGSPTCRNGAFGRRSALLE